MEHKKLLLIFCMVFLVGTISAQDFVFEQDTEVDLKIVCINAGYCSAASECNVSVFDPDNEAVLTNILATRIPSGAYHNVTLNETQTNKLGLYQVGGFCKDGSVTVEVNFNFEITPTGESLTEAKSKLLMGSFIIMMILSFFFLIFGIFTKNVPFKIFFVGLSTLLMIGTLGFSVSVFQQMFGTLGNLVETYGQIFVLLTILLTGGGFGLFVYLVYMAVKNFNAVGKFFGNGDEDDD